MKILRTTAEIDAFLRILTARASGSSEAIEKSVRTILRAVIRDGDKAVLRYSKRFDFTGTDRLTISPAEVAEHAARADKKVISALKISAKRIRAFHDNQREKSWSVSGAGAVLGQMIRPIDTANWITTSALRRL